MWRGGFLTLKCLAAWMTLIYSLKASGNYILPSKPITLIQCIRNEQCGSSHPGVGQVNHPVEVLAAADSDTHSQSARRSLPWYLRGIRRK